MSTTPLPRLEDALHIPRAEDLSALDFVIRVNAERREDALERLVDDYVVTPAVASALPGLFRHMQTAVRRGEAYGHILHGGFGSGKSHLMTLLALLLENHPVAWCKDHPAFEALRKEHRAWVERADLLVVRVHMLSARSEGAALDEVLYKAVNQALEERGKAPLQVTDARDVIAELRREAETYGEKFWEQAREHGVAGGPEDLALIESAGDEALEACARAYLEMKGRPMQAGGRKPAWGDGLKRMARHVRAQGFGGLAFFIDEFILWLAEKVGEDFVSAINDMNTIVDHAGRREAPILVVFARQRNIRDFFPELTSQDRIQQRLDHHAHRFEVTQLQDVELRHIVQGRVLRDKKDPEALERAVARVQQGYRKALDDLLGESGAEVLGDVYPFHPALIDVLVDVSNLMQRERSALRLLYELLAQNRDLPLGELLPVGRAFEHVFPPAGVEAAQKTETLQKIHKEWYGRLAPLVDAFVKRKSEEGEPVSEERAHTLRQVIKTALLGLVSPRLAGRGNERLTVERLVKLNYADAGGRRLKNKINRAYADLRSFQIEYAPELQLTGEKGQAVVGYALGQASLSELLRRAEDKVRSRRDQLRALGERLDERLPRRLKGLVGSDEGMDYEVTWRGTKRRGRVLFGNVREQPYARFEPGRGEDFRLLVDYPWDEAGHTAGEDANRVARVRRNKGSLPTAAWLPQHFTAQEERLLRELAAAAWIVDGGESSELLASYGRDDRAQLLEQARNRMLALRRQVDEAIDRAYGSHGEVKALLGARDPDLGAGTMAKDLDRIVAELLDRRFPQHPNFPKRVQQRDLARLLDWIREGWGQPGSTHFDRETGAVLERLGVPLELITVGQSRATLDPHGRFVKEVDRELGDATRVPWSPVAEKLREPPYGLPADVVDLLLGYVCLQGYRLRDRAGAPVTPVVGLRAGDYTLERADLLDLAAWSRARALGEQVLGVTLDDAHRSLAGQDRLAERLAKAARVVRDHLTALHRQLVDLGAEGSDRQQEVKEALDLLAPLVSPDADSFQALTRWLEGWPEDDAALRAAVRTAGTQQKALDELDTHSRDLLHGARGGPLGDRIETALGGLRERLEAREQVRPLRPADVERFNREAQRIVADLVKSRGGPTDPPRDGRRPEGSGGGDRGGGLGTGPRVSPSPGITERRHTYDDPSADDLRALAQELDDARRRGALVSVEVSCRLRERDR